MLKVTLFFILLFTLPALTAKPLQVLVEQSIHEHYLSFLNNRDPLTINTYSGENSNRGVVELILFQQALSLGGENAEIEFIYGPNYARIVKEVVKGNAVMAANSVWRFDTEKNSKDLFLSEAVIKNGQFEAGIYTLEKNKSVLATENIEALQMLSAVSNKQWTSDWTTLSNLNLSRLFHTVKWKSMVKMVISGRVDFLLAPFQPTEDFSFISQNHKFVPIPNIKVGLHGSRHFIVSRKHPRGAQIEKALTIGLSTLNEQGIIEQAYIESGFFNDKVANWLKLNE